MSARLGARARNWRLTLTAAITSQASVLPQLGFIRTASSRQGSLALAKAAGMEARARVAAFALLPPRVGGADSARPPAVCATRWSSPARSACTHAVLSMNLQGNEHNHKNGVFTADEELQAATKVQFGTTGESHEYSSVALPTGSDRNAQVKGSVATRPAPLDKSLVPGRKDMQGRTLLKSMNLAQLEDFVETELGTKRFRARQLWQWMYKEDKLAKSFDEMTDIAVELRSALNEKCTIDSLFVDDVVYASDGTRKIMYRLTSQPDSGTIECVWIPTDDRVTLCVSSQLGCALNCQFCATALLGLKRHLAVEEIVDQVVIAKRMFDAEKRVSNVVFMGMGEPLHNINNVLAAVNCLLDNRGLNLSHNKVTVSTSGLVPEIVRFCRESKACLAVSLNASCDETRNWLMPINRKYNMDALFSALRQEFPRRGENSGRVQRRVFFEYVMLRGVNDSMEDAQRLLKLMRSVPCKLNLIRFNSHPGSLFESSSEQQIERVRAFLAGYGMVVTRRESRGDEKMMACGQLGKIDEQSQQRPTPRLKVPAKFQPVLSAKKPIKADSQIY
ncbi:Dual-specificity RNA methyltransferase RlmN [Porphyridium purpureum]|uniref:Dual-specificity RNA methyltransferase RlmN n=1 Tax=Porphyridium purpureum TaxID=35688 RepID=A0A5J4YYY0_PORPP|nr:Dual-specificity RNA methyltransferase RlmN [Porphyridium purpureum]|eukprot:POR2456..scf208_2